MLSKFKGLKFSRKDPRNGTKKTSGLFGSPIFSMQHELGDIMKLVVLFCFLRYVMIYGSKSPSLIIFC